MWEGRFDYSRKFVGMALIVCSIMMFFKNNDFSWLVFLGSYCVIEHYVIWDRWDFYDYLIGHEWWGLYLMSLGFILSGAWSCLIISICGFIGGATYSKFNPFKTIIPTIKEVFYVK